MTAKQEKGRLGKLFTRAVMAAGIGFAMTLPIGPAQAALNNPVISNDNKPGLSENFEHAAKKKGAKTRRAASSKPRRPAYSPPHATLLMDFDTGTVISESKSDELRHPASLTKVMTLILVFDALRDGRLKLDQELTVSDHAAKQSPVKLGLKPGAKITVEDAMRLVATKSTNDMAALLGEAVGGTEENFAVMMTQKARDLGMDKTVFRNASGLPDKEQVTTARDMAAMARHLIRDYETEYHEYMGKRSVKYNGRTYTATNSLLGRYQGLDGVKTGYINASGFNLIASAERNGRRMIGVVFGGPSARSRDNEMIRLLDSGFRTKVITNIPIPVPRPPDLGAPANDNKPAPVIPPVTPIAAPFVAGPQIPRLL